MHHNLTALSRQLWCTRATSPEAFRLLNKDLSGNSARSTQFSVASVSRALQHMHHVLGAVRQTMLHSALHTAWQPLEVALAAASAAPADMAAPGAGLSVDDLLRMHSEYLAAVEAACWSNGSAASQVQFPSLACF